MSLKLQPGKYIVAVSGGVDSVVLLHMLAQQAELELVVAHFDHGIRPDSGLDADFVADLAQKRGLPFVTERVELGPGASENSARQARYNFLRRARQQAAAQATVTAHHQDDLIETAIFNLLRGTGRRGLTSLQSTAEIKRPLLHLPKSKLIDYATQHNLSWREDSTNHDERYARNHIRRRLQTHGDANARQQLLALISRQQALNAEIDASLDELLGSDFLPRQWFVDLPGLVAGEVMASWLRQHQLANFDRKTIERLVDGAKTLMTGKRLDIMQGRQLLITRSKLSII